MTVATKPSAPEGGLNAEQMLGSFFKEYADLGHWFNAANDRCLHCDVPTIDLFEDGWYGPIRPCKRAEQLARCGAE